ncbi:MAG: RNA methyltransferase PUA domain-containing protein [Bacteroidia bacterium]
MNAEYYLDPDLPFEGSFVLRSEESRHLVRVRRERVGAFVQLTNGRGRWAYCILREARADGAV